MICNLINWGSLPDWLMTCATIIVGFVAWINYQKLKEQVEDQKIYNEMTSRPIFEYRRNENGDVHTIEKKEDKEITNIYFTLINHGNGPALKTQITSAPAEVKITFGNHLTIESKGSLQLFCSEEHFYKLNKLPFTVSYTSLSGKPYSQQFNDKSQHID